MFAKVAKPLHTFDGLRDPLHILRHLWRNRELIRQLTSREVVLRYRGAYLGMIWSFANPLLMLAIYTFVFSTIFHARWAGQPEGAGGKTYFALALFTGLIPFNVFAELVTRAPTLVLAVPNYVKKVIFPLELLPVVALGSALLHSFISVLILLAGEILFQQSIPVQILLLPLAYLPLVLMCLGLGWLLASLGTYMRDMSQGVLPVVQMLTFLTPIFYPVESVPAWLQPILNTNPLTVIVGGFRQALLGQGHVIGMLPWLIWTAISLLLAEFGFAFFIQTKRGFADVL